MKNELHLSFFMDGIQDVLKLRDFIRNNKEGQRAHFIVKLFYILKLSRTEEDAKITGLLWAADYACFYINSLLLGNYIGIKQNSVNKNFEIYGFTLKHCTQNEISEVFPTVDSYKTWNKRRSSTFTFTSSTSIDDLKLISFPSPKLKTVE